MRYEIESWLTVAGGVAPYRDAIVYAIEASDPPVADLAIALGAHVTIVFCDSDSFTEVTETDPHPAHYVIAVMPVLDTTAYRRVIDQGAAGVIWVDTPVSHLIDVIRAALNHDMLLPAEFIRRVVADTNGRGDGPAIALDPTTTSILTSLSEGATPKQIALTESFSERTIQRRIASLCLALGATTTEQAVHLAHRRGLL